MFELSLSILKKKTPARFALSKARQSSCVEVSFDRRGVPRSKRRFFIPAALLFCFSSCAVFLGDPTQEHVDLLRATRAAVTLEMLQEGKIVYQTRCAKCHRLSEPVRYSDSEWGEVMSKMAKKAKLSDAEAFAVHAYLSALSARPVKPPN